MRKIWRGKLLKFIGLIILVLALPTLALAAGGPDLAIDVFATGKADDQGNILVAAAQKVKGPGFYAGNTIKLDGTVDGTTFAAGREIIVNGLVKGDLFIAGEVVTINGKINGNLYGAARKITVNGQVMGDMFAAAENLELTDQAVINRDLLVAAAQIVHSGQVGRQLFASGQNLVIAGVVKDNVKLTAEKLELKDSSRIEGNLLYFSPEQAIVADGAKVAGETSWQKVVPEVRQERKEFGEEIWGVILSIAGALLVWFIVTIWRPQFWSETARTISEEPLKTIGVGALVVFFTPFLAVLLMITVIGLPLGIMLGLAYGVGLYLSKLIAAVFIGSWLAGKLAWPAIHKGLWLVFMGLMILALLTRIPVLGFLVLVLMIFTGLGALLLAAAKKPANL